MSSNRIILKRSNIPGLIPTVNDLSVAELAINVNDNLIFTKDVNNNIVCLNDGLANTNNVYYVFDAPSTTWLVTHNKNSYPLVSVIDGLGRLVEASVRYLSLNEVEIGFSKEEVGIVSLG